MIERKENLKYWVICSNCYHQFELEDLGYFINPENNGLSGFCPYCGWIEFMKTSGLPLWIPKLTKF
jgi:rRNA maturation endonuclease Nob1